MRSQIEIYDERLLEWLDVTFRPVIADKELQLLFAPPGRAYAEVTSGQIVGHDMLKLPRISVTRQDYSYDYERQNPTIVRNCGPVTPAGLQINQAGFPIPINLPYQLHFWTEYESELQAWVAHFYRQLYAGVLYLTTYINVLWGNKIISFHPEGDINYETDEASGPEFTERRAIVPLRAETWLWDHAPVAVNRVREIKMQVADFDDHTLSYGDRRVVNPDQIGTGTGAQTVFGTTLLRLPVYAGSVLVFSIAGATEVRGYDDGVGGISGTGIVGTVDYATGVLSVAFTVPPDNLEGVFVEYMEAT